MLIFSSLRFLLDLPTPNVLNAQTEKTKTILSFMTRQSFLLRFVVPGNRAVPAIRRQSFRMAGLPDAVCRVFRGIRFRAGTHKFCAGASTSTFADVSVALLSACNPASTWTFADLSVALLSAWSGEAANFAGFGARLGLGSSVRDHGNQERLSLSASSLCKRTKKKPVNFAFRN